MDLSATCLHVLIFSAVILLHSLIIWIPSAMNDCRTLTIASDKQIA